MNLPAMRRCPLRRRCAPTALGMTGSAWAGSAIAGAASGAAVGGIAGGIYNDPQGILQGAKYGAIGGAISGPVAAMYGGINGQGGSPWSWDRVAAESASGGIASAAQGGSFKCRFSIGCSPELREDEGELTQVFRTFLSGVTIDLEVSDGQGQREGQSGARAAVIGDACPTLPMRIVSFTNGLPVYAG